MHFKPWNNNPREKYKMVIVILSIALICAMYNCVTKNSCDKTAYIKNAFEDRPIYSACVVRHVVMAKRPFPDKTALASFPGSGNTWTRHLIQQLTGLATSSEYCDARLLNDGFPFECHPEKSNAIVTKTHDPSIHSYDKSVVIIRSPYEALLSHFQIPIVGHVGTVSEDVLHKTADENFKKSIQEYIDFHRAWFVDFKGKVHLLQYSKLKKDMTSSLRALASFIDIDVTPFELNCTVHLQEGSHHRNVRADRILQMKRIYTVAMRGELERAIKIVKSFVRGRFHMDIDLGKDIAIALGED